MIREEFNAGVSQNHSQSQLNVQTTEVIAFAMVSYSRWSKEEGMVFPTITSMTHSPTHTLLTMPIILVASNVAKRISKESTLLQVKTKSAGVMNTKSR